MTRFAPDTTARLRTLLLQRGHVLSTLLADVLGGKPVALRTAEAMDGKPGMRPDEKLRATLAQVDGRRALLDAGDDAFGRCDVCGDDLGEAALGEMAWADRCRTHAAR